MIVFASPQSQAWCYAHDQISHAILPSILVYHKLLPSPLAQSSEWGIGSRDVRMYRMY